MTFGVTNDLDNTIQNLVLTGDNFVKYATKYSEYL